MSRYIILYVESLQEAISIQFTPNSVLNAAGEDYQAVYFPNSRTVYCSDKRYDEFCQCRTVAEQREFFQRRVWHYNPNELEDIQEKAERIAEVAASLTTTINNHLNGSYS